MDYREFQKIREAAKVAELEERSHDLNAPRPPLNASVNDQLFRVIFDRLTALEKKVR